ncbi:hypothetical protein ABH927_002310 [Planotetraspora sp. GP83]
MTAMSDFPASQTSAGLLHEGRRGLIRAFVRFRCPVC